MANVRARETYSDESLRGVPLAVPPVRLAERQELNGNLSGAAASWRSAAALANLQGAADLANSFTCRKNMVLDEMSRSAKRI